MYAPACGEDLGSETALTRLAGLYHRSGRRVPTKRRLKVKITTVHRESVKVPPGGLRAYCVLCGREVEFVSQARATEILGVTWSTLQTLIASSQAHGVEASTGAMWICTDSLVCARNAPVAPELLHRPKNESVYD